MIDGVLNIYKERGYTSHDVVAKLRGILHQKKIGHTGTLDPEAEGVLPVCLGKATRLCDMLTDDTKTYRAVLLLGRETDTQDTTGRVLAEKEPDVTEEEVREAVMSFVGNYDQIPPMYSARKVGGKKLYELARAGKVVERQPVTVIIHEILLENVCLPRVTMTVCCSKGTYIRTLCHDIGQKLGCGGCMEALVRTRVGRFFLEDSLKLSQVESLCEQGDFGQNIVTVEEMFCGYRKVRTRKESDGLVRNGNPLRMKDICFHGPGEQTGQSSREETFGTGADRYCRLYDSGGQFMGIYQWEEEKSCLMPWKMFLGG